MVGRQRIPLVLGIGFPLLLATFAGCYESSGSGRDGSEIDQPPPDGPLPVCSGPATDLPGGGDCWGAWIHGEQKCPTEQWCGTSVSWCLAYSDWSLGTCVCQPLVDICCPLEFLEPEDGAVITPEDDAEPWQSGIQLLIEVRVDCWAAYNVAVFVCGGPDPEPSEGVFLEPAGEGLGTAILDLGEASEGCINLCAQVQADWLDIIVMSEEITLCIQET